jgi:hypothetical protein
MAYYCGATFVKMEDQPKVYNPMTKGSAQRTVEGRDDAMKQFDRFLNNIGKESWTNLSKEELCDKSLLESFATFLATDAKTKQNESIMVGTATGYFGRVKEFLKSKFPEMPLWGLDEKVWFTPCKAALESAMKRNVIANGGIVQEQADPIGRNLMKSSAKHLWRKNSIKAFKNVFVLILTWLSIGRAGEAAKSSWKGLSYDFDSTALGLVWNELKTSKQVDMTFHCDKDCPEMDIFLNLAAYLLVGGPNTEWLFPDMERLSQPSSMITGILKDLQKDGILPNGDWTGTSLRIGSVNYLAYHPEIKNIIYPIIRGGWSHESINTFFHYLLKLAVALSVGARALSGWNNVRQGAFAPRLVFLDGFSEEERVIFISMQASLFGNYLNLLQQGVYQRRKDGKSNALPDLFDTLTASLLLHLNYLIREYTVENKIVAQVIKIASECGYSISQLQRWSSAIESDWKKINFEEEIRREDNEQMFAYFERQVRNLNGEISSLKETLSVVQSQNAEMLSYMRSHVLAPSPSLSKRKHNCDDMEANLNPNKVSKQQLSDVASALVLDKEDNDSPQEPSSEHTVPKKNAFDILKHDRVVEKVKDLKGFELFVCLKRAIRERWFVKNSDIPIENSESSTGRNNKAKIIRVLEFVQAKVMEKDEIDSWLIQKVPRREDPEFSSWEARLGTFVMKTEKKTIEKLVTLEKERGIFVKKGTNKVSGISKRIDEMEKTPVLEKKQAVSSLEIVPSTQASQSSTSSLPPLPPSITEFSVSHPSSSSSSSASSFIPDPAFNQFPSNFFAPKPSLQFSKRGPKKPSS